MSRIMITGATGFVGSRLVRSLAEAGQDVVKVGRKALSVAATFSCVMTFRILLTTATRSQAVMLLFIWRHVFMSCMMMSKTRWRHFGK